ncbi:MAG: PHP domain-containing protein [Clostridia bacterium]|nr:PHP domain-containing protein [Clostridia bacterium]
MYRYETHLHTSPVSKCAVISVRKMMEFYKKMHFDGIFITNHFLDGNIRIDKNLPYEEKIQFYFSDYEEALKLQDEIGIKVFCGVESSYIDGTDFLIYGLDKQWFLEHPEIEDMKKSQVLPYYMEHGALVIHAHPFREAGYIDHIRLFPRCVHGVETVNASRTDFENETAALYAKHYNLLSFAGTDNHGFTTDYLAGVSSETPVKNELDFVKKVLAKEMQVFTVSLDEPYANANLSTFESFK